MKLLLSSRNKLLHGVVEEVNNHHHKLKLQEQEDQEDDDLIKLFDYLITIRNNYTIYIYIY